MAAEASEPEAFPSEGAAEGDEVVDEKEAMAQMHTMLQNFWSEQMKEVRRSGIASFLRGAPTTAWPVLARLRRSTLEPGSSATTAPPRQ